MAGLARTYAFTVVGLRYFIVLGWLAAIAAAILYLPPLQSSGGAVGDLVPNGSPALQAERDAARLFGAPLNAPVAVVQRDAHGLSTATQEAAIRRAVAVDTGHTGQITGLAGALPVPNTGGAVPGARESSTTVITFLYFRPGTSIADQTAGGQQYARRYAGGREDHLVGVTGAIPATYDQGLIIQRYLPWVEMATILAIALIVGLYFRSIGAPLATLLCSGTAYLLATRVVAWTAQRIHVTLPPDVEPVLVVLLLGVTTDYSVFFMAGMRNRLAEGLSKVRAARLTTAEYAPIILAAGLMVAAGAASLAAARMQLISAFGPALALTVLTAMVVSMTLAPAFIAIFGSLLFRPGPARRRPAPGTGDEPARRGPAAFARRLRMPSLAWDPRERMARFATAQPVALLIIVACTAGLLGAASEARHLRLGSPLIKELPSSTAAARADAAASAGFAPGILAPTEVLVLGPGVTRQGQALARLQHALARRPGVAGVVGPADLPAAAQSLNVMLAKSGDAARFGIIERTDPLGPAAVDRIQALKRALPALARSAGLTGVRFEVGGETAVIGEAITSTFATLGQIALVILLVTLVLLGIFLRAVLAPFYLLAASVLALLATLGVTVWIFQVKLGYGGLVYYVPFTVAVLLVSLGSDYNVFVVGRIWEEARRRPLRDAVAIAGSQASRTITVAGVALAASFALLALIPLDQFREIAVAMAVGIIIDAIVVRSLLVPALVAFFGRAGRWPGGRRAASRSVSSQNRLVS